MGALRRDLDCTRDFSNTYMSWDDGCITQGSRLLMRLFCRIRFDTSLETILVIRICPDSWSHTTNQSYLNLMITRTNSVHTINTVPCVHTSMVRYHSTINKQWDIWTKLSVSITLHQCVTLRRKALLSELHCTLVSYWSSINSCKFPYYSKLLLEMV